MTNVRCVWKCECMNVRCECVNEKWNESQNVYFIWFELLDKYDISHINFGHRFPFFSNKAFILFSSKLYHLFSIWLKRRFNDMYGTNAMKKTKTSSEYRIKFVCSFFFQTFFYWIDFSMHYYRNKEKIANQPRLLNK